LALKAANDLLRERGKQWLWSMFDRVTSEMSRSLVEREQNLDQSLQTSLQIGRQEWEFKIDQSTMVGERLGARHRTRTLIVEIGWPRLPEHGFVPDGGLARGRVGLSQNIMLEAVTMAELSLRREAPDEPVWYILSGRKLGERLTESHLRNYMD